MIGSIVATLTTFMMVASALSDVNATSTPLTRATDKSCVDVTTDSPPDDTMSRPVLKKRSVSMCLLPDVNGERTVSMGVLAGGSDLV